MLVVADRDVTMFTYPGGPGAIDEDPVQPGLKGRPALEPVHTPQDRQPGFLHHFLSHGVVRYERAGNTHHGIVMPSDHVDEGSLVTGSGPLYIGPSRGWDGQHG